MRNVIRVLVVSMFILTTTAVLVARATPHTVYVPNYPTLAQLESGWNAAFVSWLTAQYGGVPVITGTTTYAGQAGQIFVVSSFTAGAVNGKILGRAFDPAEATHLGDGKYLYEVEENGGFTCTPGGGCGICEPHEKHNNNGTYERWCECTYWHNGENGSCALNPLGDFVGSYQLEPMYYGSLPVLY